MKRLASAFIAVAALIVPAAPAAAQHGEVQLGMAASYGTPTAFGPGMGLVGGIVLGRLAYVGVRWLAHFGGTERLGPGQPTDIKSSAHVYLADLGADIPAGPFEAIPTFSLGAVRYTQDDTQHALDLAAAAALSLHVYLAGLVLIPEVQYLVSGRPDDCAATGRTRSCLLWATEGTGAFVSFRVMIPIEVRRIRY